jgi:hypothetical protein
MNRIQYILTLVVTISCQLTWGQQIPQFSQYLRNQVLVNPGATGVYDFTDITIGGRMQWAGFENAPRTAYLTVAAPIRKKPVKPAYDPGIRVSNSIVRTPEINTARFNACMPV